MWCLPVYLYSIKPLIELSSRQRPSWGISREILGFAIIFRWGDKSQWVAHRYQYNQRVFDYIKYSVDLSRSFPQSKSLLVWSDTSDRVILIESSNGDHPVYKIFIAREQSEKQVRGLPDLHRRGHFWSERLTRFGSSGLIKLNERF